MIQNEKIIQIIFSAVDEVNQLLPKEQLIEKSVDAILFDTSSNLDSLGLINLIVTVEQKIEDELDAVISLADERTMEQENNPFKTIRSLSEYIELLLKESTNE